MLAHWFGIRMPKLIGTYFELINVNDRIKFQKMKNNSNMIIYHFRVPNYIRTVEIAIKSIRNLEILKKINF